MKEGQDEGCVILHNQQRFHCPKDVFVDHNTIELRKSNGTYFWRDLLG